MRSVLDLVQCPTLVVAPVFGPARHPTDAQVIYANRAARELAFATEGPLSAVFVDPTGTAARLVADAWTAPGSHQAVLDVWGMTPTSGALQLLAERDGDLVVITALDRAEARDARRRAELSEARFRDIVDQLQVSLTLLEPVLDGHGNLVDATVRYRNARADADRPGTTLVNRLVSEAYLQPGDYLRAAAEAWRTGRSTTAIANDGSEAMRSMRPDYMEATLARVGDLLVEIAEDRSEEHRYLEQLESSQRLYRAVADEVLQPLHINRPILDDDGEVVDFEVVYVNNAAEAVRRRQRSVVGMRSSEVLGDWGDGGPIRAARRAMLLGGAPVVLDTCVIGDDGTHHPVRLQLRRLGDHMVSFIMPPRV
jgi:hypothetical protein